MNKRKRNAYLLLMTGTISRLSADMIPLKLLPMITQSVSPVQEACLAYGAQDADELFQKIAHEAQLCTGTPANKIVPIKKVDPASEKRDILACSSNGVLFINQDLLRRKKTDIHKSIGQLRIIIFHEAVHAHQYRKNGTISVINSIYSSPEKEADIQGALLAHCWQCTAQYAENAKDENDNSSEAQNSRAQGYASKQELVAIAELQKQWGACCSYHAKQSVNQDACHWQRASEAAQTCRQP